MNTTFIEEMQKSIDACLPKNSSISTWPPLPNGIPKIWNEDEILRRKYQETASSVWPPDVFKNLNRGENTVDLYEFKLLPHKTNYKWDAYFPGIPKEELIVDLDGLTLNFEYGNIKKKLQLPKDSDLKNIEVSLVNGILTVSVAKKIPTEKLTIKVK